MIRLIVFDWDDVFTIGATKGYFKCYHETLEEMGIRLEPEDEEKKIREKWGKASEEVFMGLLGNDRSASKKADEIYHKKLFGSTYLDCIRPVPGSKELLSRLREKYIICLATGINPRLLKEKILTKFGFPDVFAQIVSSYEIDDIEKQKPHPHMIEKILEMQKVCPEESIMVGDAKGDVMMARGAGVIPVVVLTGHLSREQAEELDVEHIIEDVTKLEEVLEKMERAGN